MNLVSGIEFKSDNTQKQEKEALVAAYEDAKNKAIVLATSIGKTNVVPIKIIESDTHINPQEIIFQMKGREADSSPILVGERKIQAKVSVEFEIQ